MMELEEDSDKVALLEEFQEMTEKESEKMLDRSSNSSMKTFTHLFNGLGGSNTKTDAAVVTFSKEMETRGGDTTANFPRESVHDTLLKKEEDFASRQCKAAIKSLIFGYGISISANRTWFFAAPLFMFYLFPTSFFYVALYSLIPNLFSMLCLPILTKDLERYSRFVFASVLLATEGTFIGLQGVIFMYLFYMKNDGDMASDVKMGLLETCLVVVVLISTAIRNTVQNTRSVVLRRDWAPRLALSYPVAEERRDVLSHTNVWMIRSMVLAEIIGPVIGGLMLASSDFLVIPCFIVATTAISGLIFEYFCLYYTFLKQVKVLSVRNETARSQSVANMGMKLLSFFTGCGLLVKHRVFFVATAMGLVYYNVMAPGNGILMSFLTVGGLKSTELGIFRLVAAVFGLLGTFCFPYFEKHLSLHWATTFCLGLDVFALLGALISLFFLEHVKTLVGYCFLAAIVVSRFGLYSFDIGIANLVQLGVEPSLVGPINAQEQSLANLMLTLFYIVGTIFSRYSDFPILVGTSAGVCFTAFLLVFIFSVRFPGLEKYQQFEAPAS